MKTTGAIVLEMDLRASLVLRKLPQSILCLIIFSLSVAVMTKMMSGTANKSANTSSV